MNEVNSLVDPELTFLKGKIGQLVAQSLFTTFGYRVTPFGYENHFADLIESMSRSGRDDVTQRIRATPDLVVYDEDKKRSYLVEVKFRGLKTSPYIRLLPRDLEGYAKYWPETLLMVIAPNGPDFYCQTPEYLLEVWRQNNFRSKRKSSENWAFHSVDYFKPASQFFQKIDKTKFDSYRQCLKKKVFDVMGGFE